MKPLNPYGFNLDENSGSGYTSSSLSSFNTVGSTNSTGVNALGTLNRRATDRDKANALQTLANNSIFSNPNDAVALQRKANEASHKAFMNATRSNK